MLRIESGSLPCSEAELRAALAEYLAEREAHKKTIGVQAPWPRHEILFQIVATGGDFEVVYPSPRELALKALAERQAARALEAQDEALVLEARKPDAPQELKDYIAANPGLVAEVDARIAARIAARSKMMKID